MNWKHICDPFFPQNIPQCPFIPDEGQYKLEDHKKTVGCFCQKGICFTVVEQQDLKSRGQTWFMIGSVILICSFVHFRSEKSWEVQELHESP